MTVTDSDLWSSCAQIYEFLAHKFPERINQAVNDEVNGAFEFKSAVICKVCVYPSACSSICSSICLVVCLPIYLYAYMFVRILGLSVRLCRSVYQCVRFFRVWNVWPTTVSHLVLIFFISSISWYSQSHTSDCMALSLSRSLSLFLASIYRFFVWEIKKKSRLI